MSIEAKKPSAAPKADTKQAVPIGVLLTKVLDSERTHTSFGKLSLGDENSAPQFCKYLKSYKNSFWNRRKI